MRIGIISGSHRQGSESSRIGRYLQARYKSMFSDDDDYFYELADNPLPLWDQGLWSGDAKWQETWTPVAKELEACDSFVFISPEWSGMVPAGLKNFLLLCTAKEIGHKPGLIVGVSSSRGGTYPISELRASGYKNSRVCFIPEHLIVRESTSFFEGEEASSGDDKYMRDRCDYALRVLREYATGLAAVRESGVIDHKTYPNGM